MRFSPLLLPSALILPWTSVCMRTSHLRALRDDATKLFYHGFSNYMQHAFPEDELRPISCGPLTRDRDLPSNIGLNDVLGNYSLTLIDSLSTLAILAGGPSEGQFTGKRALRDFQTGIQEFVTYYGDGRSGASGAGLRARGFDLDSKVQVFETVIRGLGGLLSAHLFATGELPIPGYDVTPPEPGPDGDPLELEPIEWPSGFQYDGQLLRLAYDLGQRLLPAFFTTTGIPYPRVNLRHGIPFYPNSPLNEDTTLLDDGYRREITETCSAGAGSLVLEFTVLSRLTGDPRFEQAAKRAFWSVWKHRSPIGLLGSGIDAERGNWIGTAAGIGAGIDSFFEYALKSHILLSGHDLPNTTAHNSPSSSRKSRLDPNSIHSPLTDEENSADAFLKAWHEAHAAIKRYLYNGYQHPHHDYHHPSYVNGNYQSGAIVALWIDSLGAFYPGLLALAGELEEAVESNLLYTALWTRFRALPERWSVRDGQVESNIGWWPGRPEFIESTYHLYRATKDPWYLYVGEMVISDIVARCLTDCGWSGLEDVRTGEKSDRMESFFLGETAKYLYLLFEPDHVLNKLDSSFVFTTEGHPLILPRKRGARSGVPAPSNKHHATYFDERFTNSCPAPPDAYPLTGSATAARTDIFHAAGVIGLHKTPNIHGELEEVRVENSDQGPVPIFRPKSNYTYYPWTLPQTMLPANSSCHRLPSERILTIQFPSSPYVKGLSLESLLPNANVLKLPDEGLFVTSVDSMKLQLGLDDQEGHHNFGTLWRVTSVNGWPLGRDESLVINAELIADMKDPLFTCVRDSALVDLVLSYDAAVVPLSMGGKADIRAFVSAYKAAFKTMRDHVSMVLPIFQSSNGGEDPDLLHHTFDSSNDDPEHHIAMPITETFEASTPVGRGAHLVPDASNAVYSSNNDPDAPFKLGWNTFFFADDGCTVLPKEAPRDHNIIVMRRGGCSFSEKLANIPHFWPSAQSLALVVVVDEGPADGGIVRPSLEEDQVTPSRLPRHNPIPMVLVSGGYDSIYEKFQAGHTLGLRRRYYVESRGNLIHNLRVR